mgnify:FL=1
MWLVLHKDSYIFGFLYAGLLIASLIFYYAACLTDPGYVDKDTLVHLANDEVSSCYSKGLHLFSCLLFDGDLKTVSLFENCSKIKVGFNGQRLGRFSVGSLFKSCQKSVALTDFLPDIPLGIWLHCYS